jgi:4-amino-4-deoxy-L-arabinose transferase-like glycosyltransferase
VIGAIIVGVFAGGATLAIGQVAFAMINSPLIRAAIALLYAVPATIAGYHATLGLAHIGVPSEAWREVFAVIGAVLVGGTAWARMSLYNPMFAEEPVAQGPAQPQPLAGATTEG